MRKVALLMAAILALTLGLYGMALATAGEEQYEEETVVNPPPEETSPGNGHTPVVICHKPGTPAQQQLTVDSNAVPAHLAHGDTLGPCPPPVEETTVVEPPEETTVAPPEETTVVNPPEETTVVAPPEETTVAPPPEETTTPEQTEPTEPTQPEDPTGPNPPGGNGTPPGVTVIPRPPIVVEVPGDNPSAPPVNVKVTEVREREVVVVTDNGAGASLPVRDLDSSGDLSEREIVSQVKSAVQGGQLPDTGGVGFLLPVAGALLIGGALLRRYI